MKTKLFGLFISATIALTMLTSVFAESTQQIDVTFGRVKLIVNLTPVYQPTLLYNGTTYVPLRATAEMLGKEVTYDEGTSTAHIVDTTGGSPAQSNASSPAAEKNMTIQAVFGKVNLIVNGSPVDKETILYDGVTYVPLRATAELLGKDVGYASRTQTAYINEKTDGLILQEYIDSIDHIQDAKYENEYIHDKIAFLFNIIEEGDFEEASIKAVLAKKLHDMEFEKLKPAAEALATQANDIRASLEQGTLSSNELVNLYYEDYANYLMGIANVRYRLIDATNALLSEQYDLAMSDIDEAQAAYDSAFQFLTIASEAGKALNLVINASIDGHGDTAMAQRKLSQSELDKAWLSQQYLEEEQILFATNKKGFPMLYIDHSSIAHIQIICEFTDMTDEFLSSENAQATFNGMRLLKQDGILYFNYDDFSTKLTEANNREAQYAPDYF